MSTYDNVLFLPLQVVKSWPPLPVDEVVTVSPKINLLLLLAFGI